MPGEYGMACRLCVARDCKTAGSYETHSEDGLSFVVRSAPNGPFAVRDGPAWEVWFEAVLLCLRRTREEARRAVRAVKRDPVLAGVHLVMES